MRLADFFAAVLAERRGYTPKPARYPKPVSRAGGPMVLLPRMQVPAEYRPPLLPGRKSRRERANVWVPVDPQPRAEIVGGEAAA